MVALYCGQWRATFLLLGLPGIVFVRLLLFTIREPVRRRHVSTPGLDTSGALAIVALLFSRAAQFRRQVHLP